MNWLTCKTSVFKEVVFCPGLWWNTKLAAAAYNENVPVSLEKENYSHARFFPMLPPFQVLVG